MASQRISRACLILPFILWCWLAMMVVHELGHVAGAWFTGGTIQKVVLSPFTISRTDVSPNPNPTVVVWAGPVIGCLLPLSLWGAGRRVRLPLIYLLRFFAGFCLVANGAYIGVAALAAVGDASDMLRLGFSSTQLAIFGLVTTPIGIWLWHGIGLKFGLGATAGDIDPTAIYVALTLLATTFAGMLVFG